MVQNKCLNDDVLTSYLGGGLDSPVRNATEQHLVGCDECRNRLVFYMQILDEDVRKEEDSEVSAAMEQWRKQPVAVEKRRASLSLKWLAIAASVLVAVTADRNSYKLRRRIQMIMRCSPLALVLTFCLLASASYAEKFASSTQGLAGAAELLAGCGGDQAGQATRHLRGWRHYRGRCQ